VGGWVGGVGRGGAGWRVGRGGVGQGGVEGGAGLGGLGGVCVCGRGDRMREARPPRDGSLQVGGDISGGNCLHIIVGCWGLRDTPTHHPPCLPASGSLTFPPPPHAVSS
jgi:hypothetical protein